MVTLYLPMVSLSSIFVNFGNFFIDLIFYRCYSMFRKLNMEV
nr:MAG TPA: hypothetical protein [Caudoviricetes sp.]